MAVKEITDRVKDIEWDLVTLRFDKSHLKFERIGNVNVYRIGCLNKILFVPQAALFAMRRKYDFYWCIMTYMLFPAILALRAPYILTLQDGDPFERVFNRWFILPFRPLLSWGFKHAAKVQAISTFLAKWSKREDAIVIPNGVDTERFQSTKSGAQNTDIVLITTSRLVEKNGIGDLIEAMKFLPKNVRLQIIGTGHLESKLKNLATGLPVEFIGSVFQNLIPKYLHNADIFVRPSLSEGLGSSFIEAMAAGLPVIATPVGGIPDFLIHEETGLFCELKNPESIALQVKKLVSDKLLREKIIENAQKLVKEKYDWNLIASDMRSKVFDI